MSSLFKRKMSNFSVVGGLTRSGFTGIELPLTEMLAV